MFLPVLNGPQVLITLGILNQVLVRYLRQVAE